MSLLFLFALILSTILIMLNTIIGKKMIMDREKPSSFECGFDSKSSARLPFSLRFYLIALIFLIFDVEITFILPAPLLILTSQKIPLTLVTLYFIIILILGLLHEWNMGALTWDH